jgi:hypothetical protein
MFYVGGKIRRDKKAPKLKKSPPYRFAQNRIAVSCFHRARLAEVPIRRR